IPIHKPDYVVVQYTWWLYNRAVSIYGPYFFGALPMPYIVKNETELEIVPAPFRAKVFDLPLSRYKNTERGFGDFLSFTFNVSMPLFLHDSYYIRSSQLKRILSITPKPYRDKATVEKFAYNEIYEICRQNDSKMILLVIGNDPGSKDHDVFVRELKHMKVINADSVLWELLPQQDLETYNKIYKHWRGDPPQKVDDHPNPKAHKIIARTLFKELVKVKESYRDTTNLPEL
ncbi:MAG: hypothetical protein IIA45_08450, partial [Bacteroidetes bacterium]|nr:hypothetical protein [Bacteroidota bacterium]